MAKVSVLGSGSWGSALAILLSGNGHTVTLWSYLQSEVDEILETHENPSKLPGIHMPEAIHYTSDMEEAVTGMDLIVFAVPSTATRSTAEKVKEYIASGVPMITVSKGIEESTLFTQTQILEDIFPNASIGALSGPTHAEEVVKQLPTAIVAASSDRMLCILVQELFMNSYFRVYISPDVTGVELGGSLKNVIALAAGMSDGIGYGDNSKAALITRGIKEITTLATAMGGRAETLAGLTGVGDLIVTCQSIHSRNRKAGYLMGQGYTYEEAMDEVKMVVEGVYSAKAALALGQKYDVDLPIIAEVNEVLFNGKKASDGVRDLMLRERKAEDNSFSW